MICVIRRAAAIGLLTATAALGPAGAAAADDSGEFRDPSGGFADDLLLYLGIMVGVFVVIAFLVMLPRVIHRQRYRPGRPWPYDPLWFAGPDDPDVAIAGARSLPGTGGASAEW